MKSNQVKPKCYSSQTKPNKVKASQIKTNPIHKTLKPTKPHLYSVLVLQYTINTVFLKGSKGDVGPWRKKKVASTLPRPQKHASLFLPGGKITIALMKVVDRVELYTTSRGFQRLHQLQMSPISSTHRISCRQVWTSWPTLQYAKTKGNGDKTYTAVNRAMELHGQNGTGMFYTILK